MKATANVYPAGYQYTGKSVTVVTGYQRDQVRAGHWSQRMCGVSVNRAMAFR